MKLRMIPILVLSCYLGACSSTSHRLAPVESRSYMTSATPLKESSSYMVQSGDTLYGIAWRAGTDVATLAKVNALQPPYAIYPGQTILLHASNKKDKPNKPKKNIKKVLDFKPKTRLSSTNDQKITEEKNSSHQISWGWPTEGRVINAFQDKGSIAKGIDVAGALGTPILAAASGEVVYAGSALRGYGNLIIIKHNNDYLSAYAHNRRILVKNRQKVKKGQQIADMGNSGAREVKLHFEVRYHGKSVDPLRYLPPQSM